MWGKKSKKFQLLRKCNRVVIFQQNLAATCFLQNTFKLEHYRKKQFLDPALLTPAPLSLHHPGVRSRPQVSVVTTVLMKRVHAYHRIRLQATHIPSALTQPSLTSLFHVLLFPQGTYSLVAWPSLLVCAHPRPSGQCLWKGGRHGPQSLGCTSLLHQPQAWLFR